MMRMRVRIFCYLSLPLLLSCCSYKNLSLVTYKTKYTLNILRGYELTKFSDYHGIKEYYATYPDSSVVYLTAEKGGIANADKLSKYGSNISLKMLIADTLTLHGIDKKGFYWREQKMADIIVGYYNVPEVRKREFDTYLESLTRRRGK